MILNYWKALKKAAISTVIIIVIEEIAKEVKRPVVKALLNLFTYRNQSAAFDLDGRIEVETPNEATIVIERQNKDGSHIATEINLQDMTYRVTENDQTISFE